MKKLFVALLAVILMLPLFAIIPTTASEYGDNEASSGMWDAIPGDANGDKIVNTLDITFIRRYLATGYDISINTGAADVNNDNLVNTIDITFIRRYLATGYDTVLK